MGRSGQRQRDDPHAGGIHPAPYGGWAASRLGNAPDAVSRNRRASGRHDQMDRLASKPKASPPRANMTAEESLSVGVRGHLSGAGAMSEVKMFGGTGFLLNGNLAAAV